jgi:uncharacterized paraquat-inducible protein A
VNVVDYLLDTDATTVNNYDKKKENNEQIYFQLCEMCFWCASCIHLEKNNTVKCPNCNDFSLKSLPLTELPVVFNQ